MLLFHSCMTFQSWSCISDPTICFTRPNCEASGMITVWLNEQPKFDCNHATHASQHFTMSDSHCKLCGDQEHGKNCNLIYCLISKNYTEKVQGNVATVQYWQINWNAPPELLAKAGSSNWADIDFQGLRRPQELDKKWQGGWQAAPSSGWPDIASRLTRGAKIANSVSPLRDWRCLHQNDQIDHECMQLCAVAIRSSIHCNCSTNSH